MNLSLESVAERIFGSGVREIERVNGGNSSQNYHVGLSGGESFLLKFAPASVVEKVFALAKVDFKGTVPALRYAGAEEGVCAFEWIDGVNVDPENLTDGQIVALLQAYGRFSESLQCVPDRLVRPLPIENDTGVPLRVIHGDLNYRNVMFGEDGVKFVDLECLRWGLPTEDLSRPFIHAMERTRFWHCRRMRKLEDAFARLLAESACSKDEWLAAIRLYERRKSLRRERKASWSFLVRIERWLRAPLYRRLSRLVTTFGRQSSGRRVEFRKLPWHEVGHGTRRICYRLGDSGYCVKFYIPQERYDDLDVRPVARRDIEAHRHDPNRNSGCLEVEFYQKHWRKLPTDISDKLLPVVECVHDEKFGYGILETYFTNPDGTAIIPYQFELLRQKDPEARREIYRQARDLLRALIREAAFFYEPGNFHTLLHADGRIETKIVDFEPVSKMFIPLERWWPWYRRQKLRRKATRYLTSMRKDFGVDIAVETEIG